SVLRRLVPRVGQAGAGSLSRAGSRLLAWDRILLSAPTCLARSEPDVGQPASGVRACVTRRTRGCGPLACLPRAAHCEPGTVHLGAPVCCHFLQLGPFSGLRSRPDSYQDIATAHAPASSWGPWWPGDAPAATGTGTPAPGAVVGWPTAESTSSR